MLIVVMMVAIMKLLVLNFAMCVVNILGQCRLSACKKNNNCPNTVSSLRFGEIYVRWETFSSRGCSTLTESTEQRNDPVSQAGKDYVQCQLDRLAWFLIWTSKMQNVVLILNWSYWWWKDDSSFDLAGFVACGHSVCRLKRKHCQRYNGPEVWVPFSKITFLGHIASSYTNLDQISSS